MWNKPRILSWGANLAFALSVVLLLYAFIYGVVHLPIFPMRDVKVTGQLTHVSSDQIKMIVTRYIKGNFFTLDLNKTKEAFEKLPWARHVSVRRRWPDKLEVDIEEHVALGRWGDIALVNTHGELFHAASDGELPVFYGPADGVLEVAKSYVSTSQLLNQAKLKVVEVTLSPRRAWEIKTDDGMLINLGREHIEERLTKFISAYSSTLGKLSSKVSYVDLRYPNGFAVKRPAAMTLAEVAGAPVNKVAAPAKTVAKKVMH